MSRLLDTWYDVFAYALLGRILRSALAYDLAYKAIGAIVLAPLGAWVLQRLISASGSVSVTNEAIAGFLLSPAGAAFALIAAALALTSFYAEQAGLMHIATAAGRGKLTRWQDALVTALLALPRLLHLALWQVGILLLWLLPLAAIAAATYLTLLGEHDINFYLAQRPPAFLAALFVGAALGLIAAGVLVHFGTAWALAIPLCLYERLRGRAALRRSAELTRGHRWRAFRVVVLNLLLALALSTLVLWLADAGLGVLLRMVEGVDALVAATAAAVVILTGVTVLTSYFVMTVLAGSVIHLYLSLMEVDGLPDGLWKQAARGTGLPRWAIPAALLGLLGGATWVASAALADIRIGRDTQITAHRGSSAAAPENTLTALYQAISDGADFAEIDVQETADGELVLLHDKDLMRIAGIDIKVWEAQLAELRRVDAGSWFGPEFAYEPIPTLSEALKARGRRLGLNVELKYNGHDVRLAERVVEALRAEGCIDACIITSLKQDGLAQVRRIAPELRIGQIVTAAIGKPHDLDVDLLSMNQAHVTPDVVHKNRSAGLETHVWTVNTEADMARMLNYGVDNIITDHPDLLRGLMDERAELSDPELLLLALGRQLRQ